MVGYTVSEALALTIGRALQEQKQEMMSFPVSSILQRRSTTQRGLIVNSTVCRRGNLV
uniref:Uncharacterized protein n=1 Tax=Anguilla anguilla TaxID=7936 RepID=A0A0E9PKL3_ANGAN